MYHFIIILLYDNIDHILIIHIGRVIHQNESYMNEFPGYVCFIKDKVRI